MKWGWLLSAVALAVFLVVRRRRLDRLWLALGAVAVTALALVGTGAIQLPNLEELLLDVGEALGPWTYLLVGVLTFLETGAFVGFIAPGETAVIVGGVVAGQGEISLWVLIGIVWTCAVAGDTTSFLLGRRLGRAWLLRHGERFKITDERLKPVEGFFERRGGVTILVGRFIGFVRPLAPFLAGASGVPLRRFVPYDIVGAGAWAVTFSVLGYVFWHSFSTLTQYVSRGLFALGTVVAVGVGLYLLVQLRRDPVKRRRVAQWLAEREDQPLWRPLVRISGPLWRRLLRPVAGSVDASTRFGLERLMPGRLGLELTTVIALLAIGVYGFFAIGAELSEGGLKRFDEMAADGADAVAFGGLTDVMKVATDLGSLPALCAAVLLTSVWAAAEHRWQDVGALAAGVGLSYVAVHVAKAAYDRPRPNDPLIDVALSSYPSGHSAYAIGLVACAVVLVRGGAGWAVRSAVVFVALGVVALVGFSRVYLRVHFLSDVLGGFALGAAIWALCGIAALFVGSVRHNVPSSA